MAGPRGSSSQVPNATLPLPLFVRKALTGARRTDSASWHGAALAARSAFNAVTDSDSELAESTAKTLCPHIQTAPDVMHS